MANVYAVKTGNWSDVTVWNTGALPTSADDVYSNNFTVTIDQNVTVLSIRNTSASGINAGGGFVLNSGFILTAILNGAGATTLLTYTGTGTASIVGTVFVNSSGSTIVFNSTTGTLNITGDLSRANGQNGSALNITNTGTVNVVGNISTAGSSFPSTTLVISANCTLNFTGTLTYTLQNTQTGNGLILVNSASTINFSGTIDSFPQTIQDVSNIRVNVSDCIVNVTGTVRGGGNAVRTNTNRCRLTIIGPIINNSNTTAAPVSSTANDSINLFTGPFVTSQYGFSPFLVARMNYIITANSYFEFRDSSTNGALPPATSAPATRLVAPGTAIDAPAASDVRFGVVYASGSQTGTLRVPLPSQVSLGVLTDNTTGSAILTAAAIWNTQLSTMNTSGSIGERLSNVATVQTTAAQIAAF